LTKRQRSRKEQLCRRRSKRDTQRSFPKLAVTRRRRVTTTPPCHSSSHDERPPREHSRQGASRRGRPDKGRQAETPRHPLPLHRLISLFNLFNLFNVSYVQALGDVAAGILTLQLYAKDGQMTEVSRRRGTIPAPFFLAASLDSHRPFHSDRTWRN
jgi:hypothetical protein